MSLPPVQPHPTAELPGENGLLEESSLQGTQKEIKKMASERKSKKKQAETSLVYTLHEVPVNYEPTPTNLKRKAPADDLIETVNKDISGDQSDVSLVENVAMNPQNNTTDSLHAYPKRLRTQRKLFDSPTSTRTKQFNAGNVQTEIITTIEIEIENMVEKSPILDDPFYPAVALEKEGINSNKRRKNLGKTNKNVAPAALLQNEVNIPLEQALVPETITPKPHRVSSGKVTKQGKKCVKSMTVSVPEDQSIAIIPQALHKNTKNFEKKTISKTPKKRKTVSKKQETAAVLTSSPMENQVVHLDPIQVSGEQTQTAPGLDGNEIVVSHYFTPPSRDVQPNSEASHGVSEASQEVTEASQGVTEASQGVTEATQGATVSSKRKRTSSKCKKPAVKKVKWQNPNPPTVVKFKPNLPRHQLESKEVPVSFDVPVMLENSVELPGCTVKCDVDVLPKKHNVNLLVKGKKNILKNTNCVPVSADIPVVPDALVEQQECTQEMTVPTAQCKVSIPLNKYTAKPLVKNKRKNLLKKDNVAVSSDIPFVLDASVDPAKCAQEMGHRTVQHKVAVPNKKRTTKPLVKDKTKNDQKKDNVPVSSDIPVVPDASVDPAKCAQEMRHTTVKYKVAVPNKKRTRKPLVKNKQKKSNVPVSSNIPVVPDASVDPAKWAQEMGHTTVQHKVSVPSKKRTKKPLVKNKTTNELKKENAPVSSDIPVVPDASVEPPKCAQEMGHTTVQYKVAVPNNEHTTKPLVKNKTKNDQKKDNVPVSSDLPVVPDTSVDLAKCAQEMGHTTIKYKVAVPKKKRTRKPFVKNEPKKDIVPVPSNIPVVPDTSVDPAKWAQEMGHTIVQHKIAVPNKKQTTKPLVKYKRINKLKKDNAPVSSDIPVVPDASVDPPKCAQEMGHTTVQYKVAVPNNEHTTKPLVKNKRKNELKKYNVPVSSDIPVVPDASVNTNKKHTIKFLVKTKTKGKLKKKNVPVLPDVPDGSLDPPNCAQKMEDKTAQCKIAITKSVVKAKIKRKHLKKNAKSSKPRTKKRSKKPHVANNVSIKEPSAIAQKPSYHPCSQRGLTESNSTSMETVSTIGWDKNIIGRSPSSSLHNLPYPLPIPRVVLHRLCNGDYQATSKTFTPVQTMSSSSGSFLTSGNSTSPSPAQMTDNGSDLIRYLGLELSSSSSMVSDEQSNESLLKEICLFYEQSNWNEYFLNFDYETVHEQQRGGNSNGPSPGKSVHAPCKGNTNVESSVRLFPSDTASSQTGDKYLPLPKHSMVTPPVTVNNQVIIPSVKPNISHDINLHRHFDNDTPSSINKTTRKDPVTPSQSNNTCKHDSNETNSLQNNSANLPEENPGMSENEEEIDLDTISLLAESYTFETSPNSDTVSNKAANLAKVPSAQSKAEPTINETTKPLNAKVASTKFTCEKQNADSTSLLRAKYVPIHSESISDCSKSDNNLNPEVEPPLKHSLPEIQSNQTPKYGDGFNDLPLFMYANDDRCPKSFYNICRPYLLSKCTQNDCKNNHLSLLDHLQKISDNSTYFHKPKVFAREYLYMRHFLSRSPCFKAYLEVFMEHVLAKNWYKFLLEMMRDACNLLEKPQAIVEKTLHFLNSCNLEELKKCSAILGYEIIPGGPRMIHYLLSEISKSLHILKYKTILINLLSIAYENNEKVELETAINIVDKVGMLPVDIDLLGAIYSKVLKNSSIAIFSLNHLMQRFKKVLEDVAKENKDFRSHFREFVELMKHTAKPPGQDPAGCENIVNTNSSSAERLFGNTAGLQESTNTIRTSPDTTQYHDFASNTHDYNPRIPAVRFHNAPQKVFQRPPLIAAFRFPNPMHNRIGPMRFPSSPMNRPWGLRPPYRQRNCTDWHPYPRPRPPFQNRPPF